jgi:hypothetical protein
LPILAQKLSRIGDWGGSNLDANSLQSGSVLDAIQHSAGSNWLSQWRFERSSSMYRRQESILEVMCKKKILSYKYVYFSAYF